MIRIITTICTLFVLIHINVSAQTVTATQKDSLVGDHQAIGIANPYDTVRYKTTISVSGANATGVNFNNPIPANTTQVGTVKTSALCRDDVFATSFNTLLNTGNVLTNDYGLPSVSVVSFGTTGSGGTTTLAGNVGTTNGGGTLTVNANGTFSYQPFMGFTGMDQFAYIGTTGVAGLQNGLAIVTINVATDITFITVDVSPTCNGASTGSITFNASGGTGTLTYSITGAAGPYQISPTFLLLSAGTYNLAVKDAVGYIKTGTTTLSNPPLITFTTMDVHNTCNGGMTGSITFNAMGGTGTLMYSITGPMGTYQVSPVFTGLVANTYNLAVKDANNCIVTGTTIITQPGAITFTFTKTDITCNGAGNGSIVFNTITGGTSPYTYSITGTMGTFTGSTSYPGLSAATYNLVAKDVNNCISGVVSTTVIEPGAIVVSGTIPTLKYNVAMSNAPFSKTGGSGSPANPWSAMGLPNGVTINTATGVVSGTPSQTGNFSATITYTDANGCSDDLAITVMVGPNLVTDAYLDVVGNTQLVADVYMPTPTTPFTADATNILTNDLSDAAITITAVTDAATTNGGIITIGSDGKFIYTPPVANVASDSYSYTGTSNGVSGTGTINFTIAGKVWYVNNTFAGSSTGRSNTPFKTGDAAATAATLANDIIYVHTGSGNTTGNITLDASQTLRGAGNALTIGTLTIAAGTKPTLSGTVTLANSVTVDGFDMSTGGITALSSSGATSVNVNIGNITTAGPTTSVNLTNTSGTVNIAGGNMVGGAGPVFNVSGGTVSATYSGNMSQATAGQLLVAVNSGHSVGTITFQTGTLSTPNGVGLQWDNADGIYNFNGTTTLSGIVTKIYIWNGSSGTFNFGSGTSITNNISTAFDINGTSGTSSTCNVTFSGNITHNSPAAVIRILNHSLGTITFQTGTLSFSGSNTGVFCTNADGTYNFNGTANFNGSQPGIRLLNDNAGTFTFSNNTNINSLDYSVLIDGSSIANTCSMTYNGSITQSNNKSMVRVLNHNTGTLTFQTGTLSATNGDGIQFDNADGTYNFTGTTTLNGGDAGIDITNGSNGNFSFLADITNPSGTAFHVDGGSGSIGHAGTISKSSAGTLVDIVSRTGGSVTIIGTLSASGSGATGINISSNTGGTVTLSGSSKNINTGSNTAVTLSSNTGSTIDITNGGLVINTTSGTGFDATGGGTINVTGTGNTITSSSGTALNVSNTTIGASGLTFLSISAATSSKGISLNTTGSGGLTVTGSGTTDGSGGTIQSMSARGAEFISASNINLKNMNFTNASTSNGGTCNDLSTSACNADIYLNSVSTVTLDNLNITGTTAQQGINGLTVSNFTLTNSTITNCGNEVEEGCIKMRELTGTCAITNCDIAFPGQDALELVNTTGPALLFNINSSTFRDNQTSGVGGNGLQIRSQGTASIIFNVNSCTFLRLRTNGIQATAINSASNDVDVTTSTFDPGTGTMIGLDLDADDSGVLKFNIVSNPTVYSRNGPAINVFGDNSAVIDGRINSNPDVQVKSNVGSNVGSGIRANFNKDVSGRLQINGNTVNVGSDDAGIDLTGIGRVSANPGGALNTLSATVTNNNVTIGATSTYGIFIISASNAGDNNAICVNVSNNAITRHPSSIASFRARVPSTTGFFRMQGFVTNAEATWNANGNTPTSSGGSEVSFGGSGTFGSCTTTLPTNPTITPSN